MPEALARTVRQRKEMKRMQTGKGVPLLADDRIQDMQDSTRKLLQLINTLSKGAGYKINTRKSVTFLYTKDKHTEKEPGATSFHMDSLFAKGIKDLEINLTKEPKDPCNENFLRHCKKKKLGKKMKTERSPKRSPMFMDQKN